MSQVFGTYISSISSLIKGKEVTLQCSMIVVATATLNQLLTKSFFECPTSSHVAYGFSFLVLPGLILAFLSLLASKNFSLAITGICRKDIDVPETAKFGKRKRTLWHTIKNLSISVAYAVLAFCSWLAMSLLFTEAFSCTKLGPFDENLQKKFSKKSYLIEKKKYDTQSRLAGFMLLTIGIATSFFIHLLIKCCFSEPPAKELSSMRRYDEIEAKAADEVFDAVMQKSAKARGEAMVKKFLDEFRKANEKEDAALERKTVDNLRKFLALRYPRLDVNGETVIAYCVQDQLPENFSPDKVDGVGHV